MKRIFKRNQIVLTLLAVMIAVAGYLNYAGKEDTEVGSQDITEEMILAENQAAANVTGEIPSMDQDPPTETEASNHAPGEAILTNGATVTGYLSEVRLAREQVRAKSKENYMEIVNNEALSEDAKAEAVASMLTLTETAEKENAAETLLSAKGFENAIVTIVDNQADVVLARTTITDAERAQVEDIVKRKCEMEASQIVITLMELAQ